MSRPPNFILKVMDKTTDARSGKIGCAWINEDESLTIVLDPGASISYNSDLVIKLFPNDMKSVRDEMRQSRTSEPAKMPHTTWVGGLPATFFKGSKP